MDKLFKLRKSHNRFKIKSLSEFIIRKSIFLSILYIFNRNLECFRKDIIFKLFFNFPTILNSKQKYKMSRINLILKSFRINKSLNLF